jgi:hypothetical protein
MFVFPRWDTLRTLLLASLFRAHVSLTEQVRRPLRALCEQPLTVATSTDMLAGLFTFTPSRHPPKVIATICDERNVAFLHAFADL